MKALVMTQYGAIDSSLAFQDVDLAPLKSNEVRLNVAAASVNPIDNIILKGTYKSFRKLDFPSGIGRDVSGEVVEVGSGVTKFKKGDLVFARVEEEGYVGTLAEQINVLESDLSFKPSNLTHVEAASIPLIGLTAYQALIDVAQLKTGEKVLIHAGSGGVGSMAIQLAKQIGAHVTTTTSTANVDWVKALGADVVVDYKKQDYLQVIKGMDVVFDTLGDQYTVDAFKVIKTGGRVVSVSGALDDIAAKTLGLPRFIRLLLSLKARKVTKAAKAKNALYRFHPMQADGEALSQLAEYYKAGSIKTIIDKVYPFSEAKQALLHLESGRAKGKVVVEVEAAYSSAVSH